MSHMAGMVPHLAPEIVALKKGLGSMPYNKSAECLGYGNCDLSGGSGTGHAYTFVDTPALKFSRQGLP
jgi:hypothetical protein